MKNVQVNIMEMNFDPAEITVEIGDVVTWVAQQDMHTTTADSGEWDSRCLQAGQSFSKMFTTQGDFPYHCDVSPGPMLGVVHVTSPFASRPKKS